MPSIKYYIRTEESPAPIYVRFSHRNIIDAWAKTDLLVDPSHWDHKGQRLKSMKSNPDAHLTNNILSALSVAIMNAFNVSFSSGEPIDTQWLKGVVAKHFNRPDVEALEKATKADNYFVQYMKRWMETKADTFRNSKSRKTLSEKRKGILWQYIEKVMDFEKKYNGKIKIKDLTPDLADRIMEYLDIDRKYKKSTVGKYVTIHNFFCDRIFEDNLNIPKSYRCLYSPQKEKKVLEPYLNEEEILAIYRQDFSNNERLDNARDNFIIGLYTGLRVSDFLSRLRIDNIKDGMIEIETKKTNKIVAIPLHWMVEETLNKRLGMLPTKTSDPKFNLAIKDVCKAVGINREMEGYLFNSKTKRKELGIYPKYKLVSSHICRRSFATNLFGKVPNHVIMSVGGWSSETVFLNYIKKTNIENAMALKEFWDASRKNREPKRLINGIE